MLSTPRAALPAGTIWSGYAVDYASNGFDVAQGYWYVPCYYGANYYARTVQWIGLGGWGSSHLWQAGTETDAAEGYRFWYEFVPGSNIIYAGPAVTCNDFVYVHVDYDYTYYNLAYVYMWNRNNGQYWSTTKSFVPSNNSAEWIVERYSCGSDNWELTYTSDVYWSSASAANTTVYSNGTQPFTDFWYSQLNMYQNGVDLSDNSGVYSTDDFTTYYHHPGTSTC